MGNNNRFAKFIIPLLVLILSAFFTGCGSTNNESATQRNETNSTGAESLSEQTGGEEEPDKVVVGHIQAAIYGPFFVAQEKGYFAEENLDITLQRLEGGADMLIQTAAGNFDVGAGGAGAALFNAIHRGLGIQIVAPLHAERKPMVTPLVVSKAAYESGDIKSVSDLRGKTVAINAFGASTEYWLNGALASGGLKYDDVEVVAIPFPEIPAALQQGGIQAAMLGEPFATFAEREGIAIRLADDFFDGDQATVVYFNEDFANERRDVALRFMKAYLKASRDLYENYKDEENLQIIAKYTGLDLDVLQEMAAPIHSPDGWVDITNLENQQQFFMELGQLEYDQPLDITSFVNPEFAEQAVLELDR